jgi:hypothetical protein
MIGSSKHHNVSLRLSKGRIDSVCPRNNHSLNPKITSLNEYKSIIGSLKPYSTAKIIFKRQNVPSYAQAKSNSKRKDKTFHRD